MSERQKGKIQIFGLQSKECFLIAVYPENNNLVSADGQGHGSVEILPPVIHWLSITKDLCFKVLDHVLHNFTKNTMKEKQITTMCSTFQLLINCQGLPTEHTHGHTDWPSWGISQAWCRCHNGRPPVWGFPSQRSWPGAWLSCPWCQSLAVMVAWIHILALGMMGVL